MLSLTESAIDKLKTATDPTDYIRVGVVSGGRAGFSYSLAIEEEEDKRENDVIAEFGEVNVYMDPVSANMLSETTIDYVETMSNSGFKFANSKAEGTCGCGSSFSQQGCTK